MKALKQLVDMDLRFNRVLFDLLRDHKIRDLIGVLREQLENFVLRCLLFTHCIPYFLNSFQQLDGLVREYLFHLIQLENIDQAL